MSISSALLLLGGSALLLWAAVLNGYPFIYFDSGAYVLSSFQLWVPADRPIFYGLFIRWTRVYNSLWMVAAVQALVTSYLLLRTAVLVLPNLRARRYLAFGTLAATAATTGVSEFVGYVMPDIFAAWLFLGGFIVLVSTKPLDRVAGWLVILAAALVHNSHIPLALSATVAIVVTTSLFRARVPPRFSRGARLFLLPLALAVLVSSVVNGLFGVGFAPFRGGSSHLVNRFVESGVINEILATYCPRPWSLCEHRELIASKKGAVGWFLWGSDTPRSALGWDHGSGEQADIITHGMRCCIFSILASSAEASWVQFWRFKVVPDDIRRLDADHAAHRSIRDKYADEFAAFLASNQQSGRPVVVNALPLDEALVPRAYLVASTGLATVMLLRRQYHLAAMLLAPILYAMLNALIAGSTGSVASRHQGKVFWLTPYYVWLTLTFLAAAWWSNRRRSWTSRWSPRLGYLSAGFLPRTATGSSRRSSSTSPAARNQPKTSG